MRGSASLANERFKRKHRRTRWLAFGIAVLLHLALFLLMPSFGVDFAKIGASGPRMVVTVGDWAAPACVPSCDSSVVAFDTSWSQPVLRNRDDLSLEIPRLYPPLLWRYREPSHGVFEITVNASGRVRRAVFLYGSDNGGEEALLQLVRMMRYEGMPTVGSRDPTVATVEVEIDRPPR